MRYRTWCQDVICRTRGANEGVSRCQCQRTHASWLDIGGNTWTGEDTICSCRRDSSARRGRRAAAGRRGFLCTCRASYPIAHGGRDASRFYMPYPSGARNNRRSEEHTSELQSLMRISYAVFCLKKKHTTAQRENREVTEKN